jgi:hypothetical protein
LSKLLPFGWFDTEYYDTVCPFDDDRSSGYHAIWTFDAAEGVLRYTNHKCSRQISFATLRQRPVTFRDMQPVNLLVDSIPAIGPAFGPDVTFWQPPVKVNVRERAFTHAVLRDFHHQWRHILRNDYNIVTLRHLARAIIRIACLDSEVRENTGGHGRRGPHVWYMSLPPWEPFEAEVTRVGNLWVILRHDLSKGITIAKAHLTALKPAATGAIDGMTCERVPVFYVILSVKHIVLCHSVDGDALEYTAPEPLFHGYSESSLPSELALDYLTWAATIAATNRLPESNRLHQLPVEIQDEVLKYTSIGTVEAARMGCLLRIGSPFLWKDGSLKVTLEEMYRNRPPRMPVESELWFGEHQSGIVYLARRLSYPHRMLPTPDSTAHSAPPACNSPAPPAP